MLDKLDEYFMYAQQVPENIIAIGNNTLCSPLLTFTDCILWTSAESRHEPANYLANDIYLAREPILLSDSISYGYEYPSNPSFSCVMWEVFLIHQHQENPNMLIIFIYWKLADFNRIIYHLILPDITVPFWPSVQWCITLNIELSEYHDYNG